MKKLLIFIFTIFLIVGIARNVSAVPITIGNASFENDLLADGKWNRDCAIWNEEGESLAGAWNPADNDYFNNNYVPDGEQIAFVIGGAMLWQVLSETLKADTTYTLQVDVGWRNRKPLPDYEIRLFANHYNNVLSSDSSTPLILGGWITSTISYASPVTTSDNIGIALLFPSESIYQVNYDNIRLDATHTPEPSTILLLVLGLLGLIGVVDRKKVH